jgi:hypothetical protein
VGFDRLSPNFPWASSLALAEAGLLDGSKKPNELFVPSPLLILCTAPIRRFNRPQRHPEVSAMFRLRLYRQ